MKTGRSTRQGRNLVVYWQELAPIKNRLDKITVDWFTLFLRAYYLCDKTAARSIAHDEVSLLALISEANEFVNSRNKQRGSTPSVAKKRKPYTGSYSAYDYNREGASYDPEAALVEALDELQGNPIEELLVELSK